MNNNLFLIVFALLLVGCGRDETCPESLSSDALFIRGEIEAIPTWIASGLEANDRMIRLCDRMMLLPPDERNEAIHATEKAIQDFKLPTCSYADRFSAFDSWWRAMASFADFFCTRIDEKEELWRFKCQMLNHFGEEMDLFRTNTFLTANPPRMGIGLSWRSYQECLHSHLFYAVRDGFENGYFVPYYFSLPKHEQEQWLARLRKVARREVVILEPNDKDSSQKMPRYKRDSTLFGDDSIDYLEDGTPVRRRRRDNARSFSVSDKSLDMSSETIRKRIGILPLKTGRRYGEMVTCAEDFCRFLAAASQERKKDILGSLGKCFLDLQFDQSSYATREEAISEYFLVVTIWTERIRATTGIQDSLWRFKLDVLDRINIEIQRCESEPPGGPDGDMTSRAGPFTTQRQYLAFLKEKRFEFIREGFEYGSFPSYFKTLSDSAKKEWLGRLEKVANRHVVIRNLDN